MEKYYLTTAIDYANAPPHIGHAYEKIAADIIARFKRLQGHEVFFLTGTDEHGSKVEKAAIAAGLTPQAFVDGIAAKFEDAWKRLFLSNDRFIRTTENQHKQVVQAVFRKMREKGDIYKGKYIGLYCEGCEDFLRERDLKEDGTCPNHLKPPKQFEEENYFFRLTKYKEAVRQWLLDPTTHVAPDGRRLEVLHQLEDPELGDFSITRSRSALTWGIPVPDEPEQVIYVWIDALTNYLTGTGYLTDESAFKKNWPADLHLIGKDITKFHAIYWPAMLLSIEVPLPQLVFGHGFITVEGQKMSKSLGNVLDPVYLTDTYGADAIRYFLFAANTFDQDGDFSVSDMIALANGHLANGLGNLLNRLLILLEKNFDGKIPDIEVSAALLEKTKQHTDSYFANMEKFEFSKAMRDIFHIVDEANKYINDSKPWALFKEGKSTEGGGVLVTAMCMLKRAAILLFPVTPNLSAEIWEQLGFSDTLDGLTVDSPVYEIAMPVGQSVKNKGPVFRRIEDPVVSGVQN